MIYYFPDNFHSNPNKGSQIRPLEMYKAFKDNNYIVDLVIGGSFERIKQIKKIKSNIKSGIEYEFMYAESVNIPIMLTNKLRLPLLPFLDLIFFKYLKKHSIPIGIFYRDLYWRMNIKVLESSFINRILVLLNRIEWTWYTKYISYLYLPTRRLKKFLPKIDNNIIVDKLPPGSPIHVNIQEISEGNDSNKIKLFYTGGVTPPYYDMRALFNLVNSIDFLVLTVNTREEEWNSYIELYADLQSDKIEIVFENHDSIYKYYNWADVVVDIRNNKYFNNALPIKIMEAIAYEIPLILLKGSASAELIEKEELGWVFNDINEIKEFIISLNNDRSQLAKKKEFIKNKKHNFTWHSRAEQVITNLKSVSK